MKTLHWFPFILLAVALTPGALWSQTSDASYEWWRVQLESASVDTIRTNLENGEFGWPNLTSRANAGENGVTERWFELSKRFVELLGSHVRENRASAPDELVKFAEGYFSVEVALRKSGGYTNQLLANIYASYGSEFLVRAIIQDAGLHEGISKLLNGRESPCPPSVRNFILEYLEDDPLLRGHEDEFRQIDGDADANLIVAGIRLQELIPELAVTVPAETTSGLIDSPAVLALLGRITVTELTLTTLLPGYLEFIALGGKRDDLIRGNAKPLRDRMAERVYNYKFPLFGVRSLGSLAIMNLLEDTQNETQMAFRDRQLLE